MQPFGQILQIQNLESKTSLHSADDCMTLDPSFITLYFWKDSQEKKCITGFYIYRGSHVLDIPSPKRHDLVLGTLTFAIRHNLSNILLHLFTIASKTSQWRNKFQATKKCESCKSAVLFFPNLFPLLFCGCNLLSAAESGGCNLFVDLLICWQLNTNCSPAWHVGETLQKFFHDPILSSGCVGKATCQQGDSR